MRCQDHDPGDMRDCARRMLEGTCQHLLSLPPDSQVRADLLRCATALQRLEAGTWGVCQRCAAAIGRNRLLAVPEATTCAACEAEGANGAGGDRRVA